MDFRIILTILSLFVFAGCTSGPVCNKPYMWVGNDCCLDKNDNKICDKDETTTTTTFMTPTTSANQEVSKRNKYTVSSGEGDDSIKDKEPVYQRLPIVITGFVKMQPIESSIIWRNQNFEVNFSNTFKNTITLKSVTLEESITGHTCTVLVSPTIGQTVKAGEEFTIKNLDCPAKADEDSYDWIITIQYIATHGGITTTHTDTGRIKIYGYKITEGQISITGFVKMQPIRSSIIWRNQNFEVNFSNMLENYITLKSITLEETNTGDTCTVLVSPTIGQTVKAGEEFTIKSLDCPAKADEDSYDWIITIDYSDTHDGNTATYAETGHIKYDYKIKEGQQELSQKDTSGGIQVISITATDGIDGSVDNFEVLAKLSAGSDLLALNDTRILFDTKTTSQNLQFTTGAASSTYFNVTYIKDGPDHLANYLTVGDVVKITFLSTGSIGQNQTVNTRIIPKQGVIVPVNFVTPEVMAQSRIALYP